MRVIAGTAKGQRLKALPGKDTRPLTDRVKESLFSILFPRLGDARILDIYTGSGSFSIEAVSRGAAKCIAIDNSCSACAVAIENVKMLRFESSIDVRCADGSSLCAMLANKGERFDIVFADPPFADVGNPQSRFSVLLDILSPLVDDEGILILRVHEHASEPHVKGMKLYRVHRIGLSTLLFYSPGEDGP